MNLVAARAGCIPQLRAELRRRRRCCRHVLAMLPSWLGRWVPQQEETSVHMAWGEWSDSLTQNMPFGFEQTEWGFHLGRGAVIGKLGAS